MGLEARDEVGFNTEDALYLLKGNIPKDYKFNQTKPITDTTCGFIPNPTNADRVHCVIFCVDANELDNEVKEGYIKKWQEMQAKFHELQVPRIVILTKIDVLCEEVNKDVSNTFRSKKVQQVVQKASECFSLPQMYIHPVKVLTKETFPEHKQSILLLLALKQALEFAEDFIEELEAPESETTGSLQNKES